MKGKTGIIWEPFEGFSIYPSYNIEVDRITGNTNGLTGNAPALAYGCDFGTSNVCYETLSYLELVVAWDKRDDKLEPRNGWYLSFGIQKSLGGGYQYVRLFPEARGYKSWGRFTLAGKLRIGTLLGANCTVDPSPGSWRPRAAGTARSPPGSSPEEGPITGGSGAVSSRPSWRCPTTRRSSPPRW